MVLLIFVFTNISRNATQGLAYEAHMIQTPPNYQQSYHQPNNSRGCCCGSNNNEPIRVVVVDKSKTPLTKSVSFNLKLG